MPIEFRCVTCQKLLRVGDDAAGKKARCPDCGTIQEAHNSPDLTQTASPFAAATYPPNPFAEQSPTGFPVAPTPANPYLPPRTGGNLYHATREMILAKVQFPATAMLIVAGFIFVIQLMGLAAFCIAALGRNGRLDNLIWNFFGVILGLALSFIVALGAMKMRKLESYGLAMTAAVLAMLPCTTCCWLSMPFGIWSLIVLLSPDVKEAFS